MKIESLDKLLEDYLKDIYSAENQMLKVGPRIIKSCANEQVQQGMLKHAEETKGQLERLERMGKLLDIKLSGKKCKAMEGLLEEAKEILEAKGEEAIIDCALIGAQQKIEHYEIAAYGTAKAIAKELGHEEVAALLEETLNEEYAADQLLTNLCIDEVLGDARVGTEPEDDKELSSGASASR